MKKTPTQANGAHVTSSLLKQIAAALLAALAQLALIALVLSWLIVWLLHDVASALVYAIAAFLALLVW